MIKTKQFTKYKGFTLIELSVVVSILALIVAGALTVFTRSNQDTKILETKQRLRIITYAIEQYVAEYKHLPCGSGLLIAKTSHQFGRGRTSGVNTTCPDEVFGSISGNISVGGVPTGALGLHPRYMFDAWGRRITYVVDNDFTYAGSATSGFLDEIITIDIANPVVGRKYVSQPDIYIFNGTSTTSYANIRMSVDSSGNVLDDSCDSVTSIHTIAGASCTTGATGESIPTPSAFVLISHGQNGFGAYSNDGSIKILHSGNSWDLNENGTQESLNNDVSSDVNALRYYDFPSYTYGSGAANHNDDILEYRTKDYLLCFTTTGC